MFGLITRLLFAAGHSWHVYCERIDGTGPISKTQRFFYRTCFSCRSDMHVSTSASIDIGPLNKTKTNVFHTASFTCAFVKKYMYKHHAASFYMCVQSKSKYMYKQHEVSFTCAFNQNQNTCINKHLFGGPSSKATKAYCKSLCSIGCQGYNLLNRSSWK